MFNLILLCKSHSFLTRTKKNHVRVEQDLNGTEFIPSQLIKQDSNEVNFNLDHACCVYTPRGCIFSCVWPFYEWAVSNLDQSRGRVFSHVQPFYEQAVRDLDITWLLTTWSQKGRTWLKLRPLGRSRSLTAHSQKGRTQQKYGLQLLTAHSQKGRTPLKIQPSVVHSSFIEGSHMTKNTALGCSQLVHRRVAHD